MQRRSERRGFWFGLAVAVVEPTLLACTRRDWAGQEHIPASGPAIIAANHLSHIDPLAFAHFVYASGRIPRFLIKRELFDVPFLGQLLRGAGQVPVQRRTQDANHAVAAGIAALQEGRCLAIYPEGTITRDPQLWPMRARTGVARLALATGAPVVPVGQWGAQQVLWPYTRRPHLLARHTTLYRAGPPVDLSAYAGAPLSPEVLHAVTDDVMRAITEQVALLRGESPPARVHDPDRDGREPPAPPDTFARRRRSA